MLQAGNTGTIDAGGENDSIFAGGAAGGLVLLGGNGLDSINMGNATSRQTILGGNDSAMAPISSLPARRRTSYSGTAAAIPSMESAETTR